MSAWRSARASGNCEKVMGGAKSTSPNTPGSMKIRFRSRTGEERGLFAHHRGAGYRIRRYRV